MTMHVRTSAGTHLIEIEMIKNTRSIKYLHMVNNNICWQKDLPLTSQQSKMLILLNAVVSAQYMN